MSFKNFSIIAIIFIVPLLAFSILSKNDESMANKASNVNKPQIIKFTSLMCLDCKKLAGVMKQVYPKYSDKINLVEVQVQTDTPFNRQQIQKYNVTLVPTMIFINAKGKKIARVEGYVDKAKLEKYMKDLSND